MYKKRLLIYAHYYVPDTASTGQIIKELAEGLLDKFEITVICVVPSYLGTIEEKYKIKKYFWEKLCGVNVLRIRVPEFTKMNKISRVKNILVYFLGAMTATFKVGKMDYIMAVSQPPILGGLLGVWGKWVNPRSKLIYQIQDMNPEQTKAVGYIKNKIVLQTLMFFDKFSCKRSNLIITVGCDLMETLRNRFASDNNANHLKITLINNWIDDKEIYPLSADHQKVIAFKKTYGMEGKYIIMYSGNIGLYYDLENLLKVIEKFKPGTLSANGREVVFAFVGAGSVLKQMKIYTEKHQMHNVIFIPYQDKSDLIYSLNAGDVHWCVNAKGIKGVSCPSKFYALAASARPVLAVLEKGSEVQCLIEKSRCGLCCEPGEYEEVYSNIKWFIEHDGSAEAKEMGKRGREFLGVHMTKQKSIERYKEEILEC